MTGPADVLKDHMFCLTSHHRVDPSVELTPLCTIAVPRENNRRQPGKSQHTNISPPLGITPMINPFPSETSASPTRPFPRNDLGNHRGVEVEGEAQQSQLVLIQILDHEVWTMRSGVKLKIRTKSSSSSSKPLSLRASVLKESLNSVIESGSPSEDRLPFSMSDRKSAPLVSYKRARVPASLIFLATAVRHAVWNGL